MPAAYGGPELSGREAWLGRCHSDTDVSARLDLTCGTARLSAGRFRGQAAVTVMVMRPTMASPPGVHVTA